MLLTEDHMDLAWLLATAAFFGGSWGLIYLFGRLQAKE